MESLHYTLGCAYFSEVFGRIGEPRRHGFGLAGWEYLVLISEASAFFIREGIKIMEICLEIERITMLVEDFFHATQTNDGLWDLYCVKPCNINSRAARITL